MTVLTLSNGVEVWLKPTDFKADQVVFTGYAYGGRLAGAARPTIPRRRCCRRWSRWAGWAD